MATNKIPVASDREKLTAAKNYKTEGNELHKKKDFRHAIGKYHRALLQLKAIGQSKSAGLGAFMTDEDLESMGYSATVPEEVQAEATQLLADCYNNLAACLLQQDKPNYEKILDYCESVLEYTPDNVKAHYRKGLALYHMKNFEKAIDSFHQASSISKNSKDPAFKSLISKQIHLCREGIKEQDEHMKATYRSMFSQPSGSGDHG